MGKASHDIGKINSGNERGSGNDNFDSERDLFNDGEKTKIIRRLIELKSKMANLNLQVSDLENSLYNQILSLSGLITMYRLTLKENPKTEITSEFDRLFEKYIKPRKVK